MGQWLVGLRPDSDETAALIRTVFEAHLHTEPAADVSVYPVPNSLSVRAPSNTQRTRELALLLRGGSVLARTATLDECLHALARLLAGVAATSPTNTPQRARRHGDSEEPIGASATVVRVGHRLFVRGDEAILVNWAQPDFVNDRWLAGRGISEIPTWQTVVDLDRREIITPAGMDALRWDAARMTAPSPPPSPGAKRYRWTGVLTFAVPAPEPPQDPDAHQLPHGSHQHNHESDGAPGAHGAHGAHGVHGNEGHGEHGDDDDPTGVENHAFLDDAATVALLVANVDDHRQQWLTTVEGMLADGRLRIAADSRTARRAIAELLGGG